MPHAAQLIGRVKSLITQISAYAADEDVASLPKSLVLLSTTTDDTIIAICPKAHAALVKHAIKSCDTLKQYAVKVQLFEVADNGKTIPVGGPHLLIGRSGNLQCAADGEAVSVDFKVDLVAAGTSAASSDPAEGESAEAAGSEACRRLWNRRTLPPRLPAANRRNGGRIWLRCLCGNQRHRNDRGRVG